jgi:hypothetical protein
MRLKDIAHEYPGVAHLHERLCDVQAGGACQ